MENWSKQLDVQKPELLKLEEKINLLNQEKNWVYNK